MNIALKPLYYKNVHEYILKSGIHTPQIRETIARLSNGIPLALSLFTKKVRENTEPIDSVKLAHTIHILIQTVIDGLNLSENKRQQLLAASLVWRFDINILAHMMDQPIKLTDFQQLCKLPLVTKCVDGWSLLDGVRDWIRNDFKMNAPDTYFTYKQKAFELLYQRWISTDLLDPDAKSQRFIDMLYMIENEEIKNYYFRGGHVQYKRNGLTEEQLPIIEKMWREWFPEVPPFQDDHSRQEKFFRPIWVEAPTAFTTFWDGDRLAAFNAVVPLNKKTRTILQHNTPFRNYIINTRPLNDEILLWIGAPADKDDFEASSIVFRHFLQQLMERKLFTLITPVENHMTGLLSLGFTRLTWADYTSPHDELTYYVLQLDLRNKDLITMLFQHSTDESLPSQNEAKMTIKKMLTHYHQLEINEQLIEEVKRLLPMSDRDHSDPYRVAQRARRLTMDALQEIEKISPRNQIIVRTIQLVYIERIGSNELVANRLHLSLSTLYRYLRSGIEQLAMHFNHLHHKATSHQATD